MSNEQQWSCFASYYHVLSAHRSPLTISYETTQKIDSWQKGIDLVILIYEITKTYTKEENYGLISQLRQAAISVPSNIAEGAADRTVDQFRNFLSTAIGSLNEITTQLERAFRIGYLAQARP